MAARPEGMQSFTDTSVGYANLHFDKVSRRRRTLIALTPLIDVVFILLVFFMLASSFADWHWIDISATGPESDVKPAVTTKHPMLTVDGIQIRLNGESMSIGEAIKGVQQALRVQPNAIVRVKALGDTPLQAVIEILDRLKMAGISAFTIVRDRGWQSSAASTGG